MAEPQPSTSCAENASIIAKRFEYTALLGSLPVPRQCIEMHMLYDAWIQQHATITAVECQTFSMNFGTHLQLLMVKLHGAEGTAVQLVTEQPSSSTSSHPSFTNGSSFGAHRQSVMANARGDEDNAAQHVAEHSTLATQSRPISAPSNGINAAGHDAEQSTSASSSRPRPAPDTNRSSRQASSISSAASSSLQWLSRSPSAPSISLSLDNSDFNSRKRRANLDSLYRGKKRPIPNTGPVMLVASVSPNELSLTATIDHINDVILAESPPANSTQRAIINMVRSFFSHVTYNKLARSMRTITAIAPGPNNLRSNAVENSAPMVLKQCIRLLTLAVHHEVQDADVFRISQLNAIMEVHIAWEDLKAVFDNPELEGHAWLNDQIAEYRRHSTNPQRRDTSHLKKYLGSFLGYEYDDGGVRGTTSNERLDRERTYMDARFDRDMITAKSAMTALDIFGSGIFALISQNSLHDIPNSILEEVLIHVSETYPSLQTVCDILERVYVQHMLHPNSAGVGIRLDECRDFVNVRDFKVHTGDIAGLFRLTDFGNTTGSRNSISGPITPPRSNSGSSSSNSRNTSPTTSRRSSRINSTHTDTSRTNRSHPSPNPSSQSSDSRSTSPMSSEQGSRLNSVHASTSQANGSHHNHSSPTTTKAFKASAVRCPDTRSQHRSGSPRDTNPNNNKDTSVRRQQAALRGASIPKSTSRHSSTIPAVQEDVPLLRRSRSQLSAAGDHSSQLLHTGRVDKGKGRAL